MRFQTPNQKLQCDGTVCNEVRWRMEREKAVLTAYYLNYRHFIIVFIIGMYSRV